MGAATIRAGGRAASAFLLVVALLVGGPGSRPSLALGEGLGAVTIESPQALFQEPGNVGLGVGGTWSQRRPAVDLEAQTARFELTIQVPSVGAPRPGPVIVFWQLLVWGLVPDSAAIEVASLLDHRPRPFATDAVEPEIDAALSGPVQAAVTRPTCDPRGACAARVELTASLERVAEAARRLEKPWAGLAFTVVRTFDDGAWIEVLPPHDTAGGRVGTLADPGRWWGTFFQYRPFGLERASPGDLPAGLRFGEPFEQYDYGAAVRALLADPATAALTADPALPVAVWTPTPDPAGVLLVFDLTFVAPCPPDRALMAIRPGGQRFQIAALGGRSRFAGSVRLPDAPDWVLSIVTADGTQLTGEGLGTEPYDARFSGTLDCATGKGGLMSEGLPAAGPPDPEASPIEPPPAAQGESEPPRAGQDEPSAGVVLVGLLGVLLAAAIVLVAAGRRRIRS